METNLHDHGSKAQLPLYVGAVVDDYGLTPAQFRLLGHIARRGRCWAAIATIARTCRMSENTVRACLKFLVAQCLIRKEERRGETTVYWVNPKSDWQSNPYQNRAGVSFKIGEDYPTQNRGYKGSPIEGAPMEGTPKETGGLHRQSVVPDSVIEVLEFAMSRVRTVDDQMALDHQWSKDWLAKCASIILRQPASRTLEQVAGNDYVFDALSRAFRFIYFNNRMGWQLDHSWQAAYTGFAEKADYGCGPADVPKNWIPCILGADASASG